MDMYDETRHHPSQSIPNAAYPDAPHYQPGTGGGISPHDDSSLSHVGGTHHTSSGSAVTITPPSSAATPSPASWSPTDVHAEPPPPYDYNAVSRSQALLPRSLSSVISPHSMPPQPSHSGHPNQKTMIPLHELSLPMGQGSHYVPTQYAVGSQYTPSQHGESSQSQSHQEAHAQYALPPSQPQSQSPVSTPLQSSVEGDKDDIPQSHTEALRRKRKRKIICITISTIVTLICVITLLSVLITVLKRRLRNEEENDDDDDHDN